MKKPEEMTDIELHVFIQTQMVKDPDERDERYNAALKEDVMRIAKKDGATDQDIEMLVSLWDHLVSLPTLDQGEE